MLALAIVGFMIGSPARGQDTSIHVTFVSRAARASEVLKNLGRLAKVDLQTSPQTENEILIVSVKDVPLSDLMARIATATSGEWKQEGSVYRLIASSTIRRQEERNDLNRKIAEVNKAIAARIAADKKHDDKLAELLKKDAAKAKKGDDKANTEVTAEDEDPFGGETNGAGSFESKLFNAILRELDPATLAQVEPGSRLVFSTDPTRTQHPLGPNASAAINDYIQEHNAGVTNAPPELDDNELQGMSKEQADAMRAMLRRQNSKIGAIAKALLVVSQTDMGVMSFIGGSNEQLELKLYDAKGAIAYGAQSYLQDPVELAAMIQKGSVSAGSTYDPSSGQAGTNTENPKRTPVDYSEDSKALLKAEQGVQTNSFRLALSDDLRRKLYQPSRYDPLSFRQTDELLSYAKAAGRPFVADIPDSWEGAALMARPAEATVEEIKKKVDGGTEVQILSDPTYTVLKPAHPVEARNDRANRLALTTLLQAAEEKGVPSLDDMATLAMNTPKPTMTSITQMYLMLFVPSPLMDAFQSGSKWEMLRIYGGLSPEQRSTLGSGAKLPIGDLSAGAKSAMEQITYGSPVKLSVDDGKPPKNGMESIFGIDLSAMGMSGETDYRTEPTEVAAAGLPANGFIEVKVAQESFATPESVPGSVNVGAMGILGPTEMAFFQLSKSASTGTGGFPSFPKVKIGRQQVLNFTIHLAPQVIIRQKLTDHLLPKDAVSVAETNLPADFQKQIDDRLASLKASGMGNMVGGMFGAGQVHP